MASHARTTAAARLRQMATSVLIAGQRAIPVPGVAAADPVSADRRVAEAVAYLESARPRQDVLLPAWALTRMFYQLRRHALELLLVILEMHYADADNDDPAPDAAIRGVLGGYDSGTVGARDCMDEIERIMAGDAGVKLAKVVDGQAAALSEPQLDVLGRALADAVTHRDPSGQCNGCDESPAGLCEDHAADLELCESYLALARQLGIEVDW